MIKGNLLYFYLHVIVIDGLRTACDIVMGQGNVRWRCPTFAGEKALIFLVLPDVCCNVLIIRLF